MAVASSLPIPTPSINGSQASFTFSEVDQDGAPLEPLPPEIATADISIAPDGSFVETSSGPAAQTLKKRYDTHYRMNEGAGHNVPSPYTITAFVNQHGRPMFRVGKREQRTAPAASGVDIDERMSQQLAIPSAGPSRRSRVSVGLPFTKPSTTTRPPTAHRKLRKTRSFSEMATTNGPPTGRVGRGHSQSVTAADFVSAPSKDDQARMNDAFGDIMGWHPSSKASTSSRSQSQVGESAAGGRSGNTIPHPFGSAILFESPSRKPMLEFLPTPRLLREMQSFESGLTAKQGDSDSVRHLPLFDAVSLNGSDGTRPPSALRVRDSTSAASFLTQSEVADSEPINESYGPAPETTIYSRYSTDVFDVLQTYRGLPLLEKLAPGEETAVIKLSSADNTAAPRDDPRFVIWGDLVPDRDPDEQSQSSNTDGSASALSSNISKKRSIKSGKTKAEVPVLKLSPEDGPPKILVAATIERWIAQLTSDLSYDELLNFFLTYRTYISASDLCHLLICRFHWALQQPTSAQDESVRRVVRVRTFVAIRYWLLTFFSVDFLPDRDLRLQMANWLNTLSRDPILKKHSDGLSIVRKLKKVAKDCKKVHTRTSSKPKTSRPSSVKAPPEKSHVLGERFAAATRKPDEEDSDVDLDFLPDEEALLRSDSATNRGDIANAHLSTVHLAADGRTSSMPISSTLILERSDHLAPDVAASPFVQSSATLPVHSNALSRVLVKVSGRVGRWKRLLNQRGGGGNAIRVPAVACVDMEAIDLEIAVGSDLLTVNGGVQQYLKMIEPVSPPPPVASTSVPAKVITTTAASTRTPPATDAKSLPPSSEPVADESAPALPPGLSPAPEYAESVAPSTSSKPSTSSITDRSSVAHSLAPADSIRPESIDTRRSFRSTSTDSFGVPVSSGAAMFPNGAQSHWGFEVMSIDELDLSDNSSGEDGDEPALPPGLRQPVRRLPLRRDFEFVQRPESVSSMGIQSVGHLSQMSSSSDAPINGGAIAQWQMNALVDDLSDEENTGDVEAALRALEGQIDAGRVKEKASKVNNWMRTMKERFLTGDYDDVERTFSDDEEEGDGTGPSTSESDSWMDDTPATASDAGNETNDITIVDDEEVASPEAADTPVIPQGPMSPPRPSDQARPAPEDAVPLEILESRMPPRAIPSPHPPPAPVRAVSKFVTTNDAAQVPRLHHSFISSFRARDIAGHFAMIDRELFMGVKFEEVLDEWASADDVDALDWAQFLRDRAKYKSDPELAFKYSALAAVRTRFNLMSNFVVSEIVLSTPHERTAVVAKFIRIAWQSYMMNSFNALVAIVAAISSPLVGQLVKWKNVSRWEARVFNDLKQYCTHTDDFRYIRQAIADTKQDVNSHASAVGSADNDARSGKRKSMSEPKPQHSACVPFIGVYLSQLYRHNRLPDLIDPTAPTEAVGIDPVTHNFDSPAHPEVFSALAPLPESIHLEPLINVHKQRMIAGVIKSMVAGQHLASRFDYTIDKRLYQKCLRLRGGVGAAFFPEAQDMGVYGSNFMNVQGNFVVNAPVPPHAGAGSEPQAGADGVEPRIQPDSLFYSAQLLRQGRGFPLYEPSPQQNLPAGYRDNGVSIGDVGRVTPDGIFDFLFNIYRAANDPIHVRGVPENFQPLERAADEAVVYGGGDPFELFVLDNPPGDYVSTASVEEHAALSEATFPGANFVFRCRGATGAVLALPHGSQTQRHLNMDVLRAYAAKHAYSWYKFANGPRGRGLRNGSLCLVYGAEKAPSWGMATFRRLPTNETFPLPFHPIANSEERGFEYRWARGTPARTKTKISLRSLNQTPFIHGLTMSLGESLRASFFGKVELSELVDSAAAELEGRGGSKTIPYSGGGSLFSLSFGFFYSASGRQHAGATRVEDTNALPEIINPSEIINNYILQQYPSTLVAITDDDVWKDIMRETTTSEPIKSEADLITRVLDSYNIVQVEGTTYLARKAENLTSDASGLASSTLLHSAPAASQGNQWPRDGLFAEVMGWKALPNNLASKSFPIQHPFGPGMMFRSSFADPEQPKANEDSASMEDSLTRPFTPSSNSNNSPATGFSPEAFDFLQKFEGVRQSSRAASNTLAQDDPRFVIWGYLADQQDTEEVIHAATSASKNRFIVAATLERWVVNLTTDGSIAELSTFLLTYRSYINAMELCELLIRRFRWAMDLPLGTASSMGDSVGGTAPLPYHSDSDDLRGSPNLMPPPSPPSPRFSIRPGSPSDPGAPAAKRQRRDSGAASDASSDDGGRVAGRQPKWLRDSARSQPSGSRPRFLPPKEKPQTRFPTTAMREEVGRSIGISARKVQIWFQNQREKARRPQAQTHRKRGETDVENASPWPSSSMITPVVAAPDSKNRFSNDTSATVQNHEPPHLWYSSSFATSSTGGPEAKESHSTSDNQFLDADLLRGVCELHFPASSIRAHVLLAIGFNTPSLTAQPVHMQGAIPNVISLPYGACPPLHLNALSWPHLLKVMAKFSDTRFEAAAEASALARSSQMRLRTVVQFIRLRPSDDWRTVLWITIDHPVPASAANSKIYTGNNVDVLPWSYTLSSLPTLFRDSTDTESQCYTIPETANVPFPVLPITFPDMAVYLQAALNESRRAADENEGGMGKLSKMVASCYPSAFGPGPDEDRPKTSNESRTALEIMKGLETKAPQSSTAPRLFPLFSPLSPPSSLPAASYQSAGKQLRRMVLQKTFTAIRLWLSSFFGEDFIPNRELRVRMGTWIAELSRDPVWNVDHEGAAMVRQLRFVARISKDLYPQQLLPLVDLFSQDDHIGAIPATGAGAEDVDFDGLSWAVNVAPPSPRVHTPLQTPQSVTPFVPFEYFDPAAAIESHMASLLELRPGDLDPPVFPPVSETASSPGSEIHQPALEEDDQDSLRVDDPEHASALQALERQLDDMSREKQTRMNTWMRSMREQSAQRDYPNTGSPSLNEGEDNEVSMHEASVQTSNRSFVLDFRSRDIAGQLGIIDGRLFVRTKLEGMRVLDLHEWSSVENVEALDWEQILHRPSVPAQDSEVPTMPNALAILRARFNLISDFIVSEIASTTPEERAALVAKFIRIAWHSYMLKSFNTLVAIVAAISNASIGQLVKWEDSPHCQWEARVFRNLRQYCTNADDFKYLRHAIEAEDNIEGAWPQQGACVPFIGVYLAQLRRYNQLPHLIDPTTPTVVVTHKSAALAHPEVFAALAPLPSSVQLQPLINVHKQRLLAGVVKSMIEGQDRALRFHYEVANQRLYQKCVHLEFDARALDRVLATNPPES
ncbi:hypothetical protein MKEN_01137800 [Mycena kentingensis (nom. inval.)]|nr:hypothetical protein MKEN_01137800 [Mycena kentingensis (nom. inval.)]